MQNAHLKCNSIEVEGVKYIGEVNFVDKLKTNNLKDGPLQSLCNLVPTNPKFNETSDTQEIHKFLFTKEDVQSVVSSKEMYGIIIELVDSLRMVVAQRQEQSLDIKPIAKFIVEKEDSSILTYEDLAMAFHMGTFSNKNTLLVEAADKYNVLKGATISSMSKNLERWSNEAQRMGLGWVPIDDNAIGFRVESVQAWLVALILIHEAQCDVKLQDKVDFKFGIDARTIANSHSRICEVMLELLCNPSPLSCISVAKWEGKDQQWDDFFSHVAKTTDPKSLLHQLLAVCEDGLKIEDRHLDVTFIECHHMAFYCSDVYRGRINTFEERFCPWCTVSRQSRCIVTMDHNIAATDTVQVLSSTYHMRPQLLVVCIYKLIYIEHSHHIAFNHLFEFNYKFLFD